MKNHIDPTKIPSHIAVIMDGNGRWAQKQGVKRILGHQNAIEAVRNVTEGAAELGVKYLTLFAFSTENWSRPKLEVDGLMTLLVNTVKNELSILQEKDIKLSFIGEMSKLPLTARKSLNQAIKITSGNNGMELILALNYSGQWDLTQAVNKLILATEGKVSASDIEKHLSTSGKPNPELLIRTSGEMRISNFMLWQLAYTELYFMDILWPDFRKKDLCRAIISYQRRERRFGKTSDQMNI
ncbi:MAG: isoprenyl transferase [Bacteroidota bacterium]